MHPTIFSDPMVRARQPVPLCAHRSPPIRSDNTESSRCATAQNTLRLTHAQLCACALVSQPLTLPLFVLLREHHQHAECASHSTADAIALPHNKAQAPTVARRARRALDWHDISIFSPAPPLHSNLQLPPFHLAPPPLATDRGRRLSHRPTSPQEELPSPR